MLVHNWHGFRKFKILDTPFPLCKWPSFCHIWNQCQQATLALVSPSLKTSVWLCWIMINKLIIYVCVASSTAPQNAPKNKEPSFLTTLLPSNSHDPSSSPPVNISAHLPLVQSHHLDQVDKTSPYMFTCRGQNGTSESEHVQVVLYTTEPIRDLTLVYETKWLREN